MIHATRRRAVALATASLLAAGRADARVDDGSARFAAIERKSGGRLGVFAIDTGTGRTLSRRADERFLMQSTFKLPLAAAVLSRVADGRDLLSAPVRFAASDLVGHSPATRAHLQSVRRSSDTLPVGTLVDAMMEQSDNAAANLLLARIGGPAPFAAFLRSLGDTVTIVDRPEPVKGWSGTEDTTTPRAMAGTARAILLGPALPPVGRYRLIALMRSCTLGLGRLRAAIPASWNGGDRTGTDGETCNDVLVAWPPGRAPIVVVAFDDTSGADSGRGETTLRDAGRIVAGWASA